VLALAALAHGGGLVRLRGAIEGKTLSVAAVQPAILPTERDADHAEEHFARLARLTHDAHAQAQAHGVDLVVWPETAVGNLENDLETKLAVRDVVKDVGVPLVFGSSEIEMLDAPAATRRSRSFNGAFVMEPGKPVAEPYRKVRLVPFAEYRPIDLPAWAAPRMFETERGARHFPLRTDAVVVEPLICWESLFAGEVHATVSDEPSVITLLVNDAWFGPTAQPELHNQVSAFRAAEAGRPLVIASNTGPSWIIDARGRVVARTPRAFEPAFITATVTAPSGQTPYRQWGDWTWILPMLAAIAALRLRSVPSRGRIDATL
jgi:apolipoprotein N-acyltransferase